MSRKKKKVNADKGKQLYSLSNLTISLKKKKLCPNIQYSIHIHTHINIYFYNLLHLMKEEGQNVMLKDPEKKKKTLNKKKSKIKKGNKYVRFLDISFLFLFLLKVERVD